MAGILAVDIHDTIANYFRGMVLEYGQPVVRGAGLEAGWPEVDFDDHFQEDNHNRFLAGLEPIQGAEETLQLLWLHGWDIQYVTAADHANRKTTQRWLDFHGFPQPHQVKTQQGNTSKQRYYSRVPAGYYKAVIDDIPMILRHVKRLQEVNPMGLPKAIRFVQPHNEQMDSSEVDGDIPAWNPEEVSRLLSRILP